jgi:hypothetical protein
MRRYYYLSRKLSRGRGAQSERETFMSEIIEQLVEVGWWEQLEG